MPTKSLIFHDEARAKMVAGVNMLADAVKITLGPRGRNVIIDQGSVPLVANSGVVVARNITLADPFANMGAQMLKEVARRTSDVAGDGNTTATTLAQAIVNEGMKYVVADLNPMDIKRGIELAVDTVVAELKRLAKPCRGSKAIAQVSAISANSDLAIGQLIAEAMDHVGPDGAITVEEGSGLSSELEVVEGMQFDRGYLSPYFVNNPDKQNAVLEDAFVLLYSKKISSIQDILPMLDAVHKTGKPLLIVAEDVEGEALATLVVNSMRGTLKTCAVKAPGFGARRAAMMEDIAAITGATLVSEETGLVLDHVTLEQLGEAKRIEIDKDNTTIVNGAGPRERIDARIAQLRAELETSKPGYDRDRLKERLAKLAGGVAVIKVGAATETEMKERRSRVDDALHATRAAVEEGIVPGGGVALLRARRVLEHLRSPNLEQDAGVKIVYRALEEPLRQIVANAGLDASVIVHKVDEGESGFGYNVAEDLYGDMLEMGVIDPAKVTRSALQNAASIAGLLLTTDCMIAELPAPLKAPGVGEMGEY